MIYIKKFKEKLKKFILYLQKYAYVNLTAILMVMVCIYTFVSKQEYLDYALQILLFSIPLFAVHLTLEKKESKASDKNEEISSTKSTFKSISSKILWYLFKYIKYYAFFIFNFFIVGILMYSSMFISLTFLMLKTEPSFIVALLLLLSTFFVVEGISLVLNFIPTLVILNDKEFNPVKAIFKARKINGKIYLKHRLNVVIFIVALIPIVLASDAIHTAIYISWLLRLVYILLVLNYAIFDFKTILEENEDKVLYSKNKIKLFKLFARKK